MNRGFILVVLLGLTLSFGLWPLARPYFPRTLNEVQQAIPQEPIPTNTSMFTITSPDFLSHGQLPLTQTCEGRGIAPELRFTGIPEKTVAFALIMTDIDVPTMPGGKYYHWGMWNVPASLSTLSAGSIPREAQLAINSSGKQSYVPACPPSGEHRYVFTAYALSSTLDLPARTTIPQLEAALKKKTISSASLISRYKRK